jgi:branched-chain amino acid transport system permease protein
MTALASARQRMTPGFMRDQRQRKTAGTITAVVAVTFVAILPLFFSLTASFVGTATTALAYIVMALGLNIVVGFAGLLDLGYVAFYAFGAYAMGWYGSSFLVREDSEASITIFSSDEVASLPGFHFNFLLIVLLAVFICAIAGILIGLPTLRLRGDYIAIVTLAFGEIIRVVAINGETLTPFGYQVTNGRQGITPIDIPYLPGYGQLPTVFENLRPWFWLALVMVLITLFANIRLRDSRLGRAWIALREDEVAAASMGVPIVRTKLLAYAAGAGFGGMAGAFLGAYLTTVNADQFEFSFSIIILAMVILGGLGSVWGVVIGAAALAFIEREFIPNQLPDLLSNLGLTLDATQLNAGVFGFLLVTMMVLRPEGLLPERRRKLEMEQGVGTGGESVYEARA